MTQRKLIFLALIGSLSSFTRCFAQSLSQETAYEVMFREIVRFEGDAAQIEQRGQSAADLRNRYKSLFGLSNRSDMALKATAKSCVTEVATIDARASSIIQATKDRLRPKPQAIERAGSVPPIPAELIALQQQKTNTVRKWMDSLEDQLGRGDMALLSAAVRRHVSSHSKQAAPAAK